MTQATPTKAGHALLAVALGALEAATDKNSWRNPDQATRQYLDQLAAWGYTLSDVETLITDPDSATRTEATSEDDAASENTPTEEADAEEPDTANADEESGTDEDDDTSTATDGQGAKDVTVLENPTDTEEPSTEKEAADPTQASGTGEGDAPDGEVADAA